MQRLRGLNIIENWNRWERIDKQVGKVALERKGVRGGIDSSKDVITFIAYVFMDMMLIEESPFVIYQL